MGRRGLIGRPARGLAAVAVAAALLLGACSDDEAADPGTGGEREAPSGDAPRLPAEPGAEDVEAFADLELPEGAENLLIASPSTGSGLVYVRFNAPQDQVDALLEELGGPPLDDEPNQAAAQGPLWEPAAPGDGTAYTESTSEAGVTRQLGVVGGGQLAKVRLVATAGGAPHGGGGPATDDGA